jgi:hypothetical protein
LHEQDDYPKKLNESRSIARNYPSATRRYPPGFAKTGR